jgi:hypothetical protein
MLFAPEAQAALLAASVADLCNEQQGGLMSSATSGYFVFAQARAEPSRQSSDRCRTAGRYLRLNAWIHCCLV